MSEYFSGNFTQKQPIPDEAIEAAMSVLQSGRLHRYNVAEGKLSQTALLEQVFAAAMGGKVCPSGIVRRLCHCNGLACGGGEA